jgi:protein transport protein SEC20
MLTISSGQSAFRKAQLAAKRNLELSQRAEREILLQTLISPASPSSSKPVSRRRTPAPAEQTQDEKLVGSAGDVTAALRRTHALMANELSRSQFAHDTLKESTAALDQLSESYTSLDSVLASTKGLLGMLLKSQKSDTWYLETAFYVLLATISWLVFRRFIYGPAWLLLYLPRKALWYAWIALSTVLGLGAGSSAVSVSSPGVGTTIMPVSGTATQATMSGTDAPEVRRPGRGDAVPPMPPREDEEGRRLVDIVGKMAEDTREQGQEQGQPERNDGQPQEEEVQRNPKKRMWDADVEARKQEEEQKKKDEL